MKRYNFSFILILLGLGTLLFSKPPIKFGDVQVDDLNYNVCPIDSNAHAYFISDYGTSEFVYFATKISSDETANSDKGFQIIFRRHFRIKVLDNLGVYTADVEIPLYHRHNDEERLQNLKGATYNLVDGKIQKTKLDNKTIIREEVDENHISIKIPMPNVVPGSVFEVEYSIISDFIFNLQEWRFQNFIPVLKSEYHVAIPEYFRYNQTQKGYFPIKIESGSKSNSITITYEQKAEGASEKGYRYTQKYDYVEKTFDYFAENIEAFPSEKYLKTPNTYIAKIEFELASTKYPNSLVKSYTKTWEDINKLLLEDDKFGLEIKKNHSFSSIIGDDKTDAEGIELVQFLFNKTKNYFTWNGKKRVYITKTLNDAIDNKSGNSADINLCLVSLLNKMGIESFPVIMSTQSSGIIHPAHPSIASCNYVVALATINGTNYLMDATEPLSEINMLPVRCLNDKGRIVNESGGDWISLNPNKTFIMQSIYNLKINPESNITGNTERVSNEYAAFNSRKDMEKYSSVDDYVSSENEKSNNIEISNYFRKDSTNGSVKENFDLIIKNCYEELGGNIYFKPLLLPYIDENPFKLPERKYPVEFNYPVTVIQTFQIEIPKSYNIESLPKSAMLSLPEQAGKYIYQVTQINDLIQVTSILSIKKTIFISEEYENLKQFYNKIIEKQNQLVTLQIKE